MSTSLPLDSIRSANSLAVAQSRKSDFRKQKEIDEARKAGTMPAAVDEDGHEINPYLSTCLHMSPFI